jgi:hypothetical protein
MPVNGQANRLKSKTTTSTATTAAKAAAILKRESPAKTGIARMQTTKKAQMTECRS